MTQTMQSPQSPAGAQQPVYELSDADRKRVEQITAAWKAYDGLLSEPLVPLAGQPNDNILTNQMQAVVDRGIDFLFGKELEISVEQGAPAEAQDFLNDTWGRKEARIPLLQKLAMNGALAGQAFLRIVPSKSGSFRLVVVDPSTVFVQTAPQDCETVLLYCIEYCTTEKINGRPAQVFYHEEINRVDPSPDSNNDGYEDIDPNGLDADVTWSIQHWSRIGQMGKWTPAGAPIAWPYPFPPLFSCQNLPRPNDFWGTPDITPDLIGVNVSLNLVQSLINRVNKLYGHPFIYSTGTSLGPPLDVSPGRIIELPPEGKIVSVPITSDIANALTLAGNLRSDIDQQSGVPGVAIGRIEQMPRGNLSGIAIELLFMPLLKKTEKKQMLYGELILDVSKALLVLNKMSGDIEMTLAWQSPLPSDDLAAVQAAIAKRELGISDATLQREIGYDPEEEMQLSQAEDEQKLEKMINSQVAMPPALPGTKPLPGQQPAPPPGAPAPAPPSGARQAQRAPVGQPPPGGAEK